MTIHQLSDSIINKIAAGEVIERPANVIKELLENAFDAGATEIKIEIEESGLKRIKITDNGKGMEREDLQLAWKRHTTSKIASEEDLFEIQSLGFRGEALASIAEVSHISIKSKTQESDVGNIIEIEGGILLREEKVGCPDGTIIEITNLFYNVPARKKFLKSPEVELAHIIDIITRYALIKKETSIILLHNGKEIVNSQKTQNNLNNIIFIYGTETAKDLIEVYHQEEGVTIEGFISKPSLTRANKNEQSLYLNQRYIKSSTITDTIYRGYKTLLFTNRHPIFILNITIEASEADVNIHPNKLEVRFKEEEKVSECMYNAIQKALEEQLVIRTVSPEKETERKATKEYAITSEKQSNLFIEETKKEETKRIIAQEEFQKTINNMPVETSTKNKFENLEIIGQVNKTYIIAESTDGLVIIDQHAAEERVNYEIFMKDLQENAIQKQQLIDGTVIELTPIQFQTVSNNKDLLERIGFEFEEFGGTAIKLSTIPEIFGRKKGNLFMDIINELSKISINLVEKEVEDRIIRFSCRASIKAGDELTTFQMKDLIRKLGETENPYSCPHGRPTIIQLTNADLEKKFKRTGW